MIDVALKEWQIVVDLLLSGELAILLRKGGIHEEEGPGEFEMRYQRFAWFPTWDHQKPEMIKLPYRERIEQSRDPLEIPIRGYGESAKIWQVPSREAFGELDDLHCWTPAHVDMRFEYRPDRPLFLVAVRSYVLPESRMIRYRADFAGCMSWIGLSEEERIDPAKAKPVIEDDVFDGMVERIDRTFAAATS